MAVVFKTFDVIEIDGVPAGNIVDVISNHGPRRAEVLAAFGVYVAAINAEKATLVADLATKTTAYDAEVAKVTALEAEKATLTSEKATLTTELSEANATIAGLQSRVTELEALVIELTPPPIPQSITRYQCTTWLRSATLLQPAQTVSDLIRLIVEDPEQQLRALDRWELGTAVLRIDPMIETLGLLLGLNSEQLDAAFLQASQIQ